MRGATRSATIKSSAIASASFRRRIHGAKKSRRLPSCAPGSQAHRFDFHPEKISSWITETSVSAAPRSAASAPAGDSRCCCSPRLWRPASSVAGRRPRSATLDAPSCCSSATALRAAGRSESKRSRVARAQAERRGARRALYQRGYPAIPPRAHWLASSRTRKPSERGRGRARANDAFRRINRLETQRNLLAIVKTFSNAGPRHRRADGFSAARAPAYMLSMNRTVEGSRATPERHSSRIFWPASQGRGPQPPDGIHRTPRAPYVAETSGRRSCALSPPNLQPSKLKLRSGSSMGGERETRVRFALCWDASTRLPEACRHVHVATMLALVLCAAAASLRTQASGIRTRERRPTVRDGAPSRICDASNACR